MNNNKISVALAELLEETPKLEEAGKDLNKNPIDFDNDPEFVADYLKATFINDVMGSMKSQNITKTVLADKLGKSKQYVGRILNETTNYTIETISSIACALNQEVVLTLRSKEHKKTIHQPEKIISEDQEEVTVLYKNPNEQAENKLNPHLIQFILQKTYSR